MSSKDSFLDNLDDDDDSEQNKGKKTSLQSQNSGKKPQSAMDNRKAGYQDHSGSSLGISDDDIPSEDIAEDDDLDQVHKSLTPSVPEHKPSQNTLGSRPVSSSGTPIAGTSSKPHTPPSASRPGTPPTSSQPRNPATPLLQESKPNSSRPETPLSRSDSLLSSHLSTPKASTSKAPSPRTSQSGGQQSAIPPSASRTNSRPQSPATRSISEIPTSNSRPHTPSHKPEDLSSSSLGGRPQVSRSNSIKESGLSLSASRPSTPPHPVSSQPQTPRDRSQPPNPVGGSRPPTPAQKLSPEAQSPAAVSVQGSRPPTPGSASPHGDPHARSEPRTPGSASRQYTPAGSRAPTPPLGSRVQSPVIPALASGGGSRPGSASGPHKPDILIIDADDQHHPHKPIPRLHSHIHAIVEPLDPHAPHSLAELADPNKEAGLVDSRTGFAVPTPYQLFRLYDTDHTGGIDIIEFGQMLQDLDGRNADGTLISTLAGTPTGNRPPVSTKEALEEQKKWKKYVESEFERADIGNDGLLNIDEFFMYYYTDLCFKFPLNREGVNPGADLFNIFVKYSNLGQTTRDEMMNLTQFSKLIRDGGLIGKSLTYADADIIYTRARAEAGHLAGKKGRHGSHKTNQMFYMQFVFALDKIAHKRKTGFYEVVSKILGKIDTLMPPSQADLLVFTNKGQPVEDYLLRPPGLPPHPKPHLNPHVQRLQQEGEEVVEFYRFIAAEKRRKQQEKEAREAAGEKVEDEEDPQDKELQDGPTGKTVMTSQEKEQWGFGKTGYVDLPRTGSAALKSPKILYKARELHLDDLMMALKRVFERYCVWGGGLNKSSIDKIRFAKSLRDSGLLVENSPLGNAEMDHIFTNVLPAAQRGLNFVQYIEALRHVSTLHRLSLNEVMERIVIVGRPQPVGL